MSDVTSRLVQGHLDFLATRGHDLNHLYEALLASDPGDENLRREIISDSRKRIPWNSFATSSAVLSRFYTDNDSKLAFFEHTFDSAWIPYFRTLVGLVADPIQLYRMMGKLVIPTIFGNIVSSTVETVSDRELVFRIKTSDDFEPVPMFMDFNTYGFTKMPWLLGLPDAIVKATVGPREGVYHITVPPAKTLWLRIKQIFRLLLKPKTVLDELVTRDQMNRSDYIALQESERELRSIRADLEQRVQERTRELESRIEEILTKEQENRQLNAQVLHLQKLEALGTLVGGISHEINNVLHGILLANTAAGQALEPDHAAREPLGVERKFALRGQEVMRQVLAFSRKVEVKRRAIAIVPVIQELVKLMRATLPKNIDIREEYFESDTQPLAILGDETQLQQILVNLFSNAAHAMRVKGGVLTIRVRRASNYNEALIEVIDDGEGISEAVRDRIFEPFFTTKPVGQGTGMGLSMVYGLVQAFGGRVAFESKAGEGSTFRVYLPLTQLVEINTVNDLDFLETHGSERVLLVDDEQELLGVLRDTLSTFGYKVTIASSGAEALQILEREKFDLVITDQIMPGMTGSDLATAIKKRWPFTLTILCTGYSEAGEISAGVDPFDGRVLKPIDAVELGSVMRQTLSDREKQALRHSGFHASHPN